MNTQPTLNSGTLKVGGLINNIPQFRPSTPSPTPSVTQPQVTVPQTNQGELDKDAVNLSKAIRQVETGNQVKPGATGELPSRYQFMPDTWKGYAKEVLGDENAPMTLENENKVAYTKIKKWKDEGLNPGQIASMWNSGSPDNYNNDHRGYNNGVYYDTPAYAKKVYTEYQKLKEQSQNEFNPTPFSNPSEDTRIQSGEQTSESSINTQPESKDTLGSQIGERFNDLKQTWKDTVEGKINPLETGLQTVGSAAGVLGDVINKGIELIPGVKAIEGLIGKGAQSFFNTDAGKAVAYSLSEFQQKNPELSKDLGAGFNIITAFPILKGISSVGSLALDSASGALKNSAKNVIAKDLVGVAGGTQKGLKALRGIKGDLDILINNKAIPELVNEGGVTRYATENAYNTISSKMSGLEDDLVSKLMATSNGAINTQIPLETLRQDALNTVKSKFRGYPNFNQALAEVNKTFDSYTASMGDFVPLEDLQKMKINIGQGINFASPKVEQDVTNHIRRTLMKSVEDYAGKVGIDVKPVNLELQNLYKAQDFLNAIKDKRVINKGLGHNIVKGASTAAGAGIGSLFGGVGSVPGAAIGYSAAGSVEKALGGLSQRALSRQILKRSGNAVLNTSSKNVPSKIGGLLGSALTQKLNQSKLK